MRGLLRAVVPLVLAGTGLLGFAGPASAHPLGNFTVNAYAGVTVGPGSVEIDYVLDLAEIPTFQELTRVDTDSDGGVDEAERRAAASAMAEELLAGLSLEVDDGPVPLSLVGARIDLLPGQGGLEVLRLEATYRAPAPSTGRVRFSDANHEGRPGWREITAVGEDGVAVGASTVPSSSISRRLQAYPNDLLASPLDVRTASFRFGPGQQEQGIAEEAGPVSGRPLPTGSPLADLAAGPRITPALVLLALLGAAGLGAVHALSPGHGKTVTAAYLAGSGSGLRQALRLGLAVSLMHTISVGVVGGLILLAQSTFPAERVYSWLGLAAGIAATSLGGWLLVSRLRSPARAGEHTHSHGSMSRPALATLAASGGLLPSPTALIVLVASVTLGRALLGVGIILAFSVGLAATLAGIGMLAVGARELLLRRFWSRAAKVLPVASAAAILLAGMVLVTKTALDL
ncbi:MAG TPA: High-affinity nickel-transporter [Actinomycetota bacterium]|nr:High-affinity nickel-transporter [Actinomycetota bacterium]